MSGVAYVVDIGEIIDGRGFVEKDEIRQIDEMVSQGEMVLLGDDLESLAHDIGINEGDFVIVERENDE